MRVAHQDKQPSRVGMQGMLKTNQDKQPSRVRNARYAQDQSRQATIKSKECKVCAWPIKTSNHQE